MKTTSTKLLVSVTKNEATKNELGLVVPSSLENEGLEKAKVLYIGEEVKSDLKVGDTIYIYSGSGKEFTNPEDQEKYRVISVADIVVIF